MLFTNKLAHYGDMLAIPFFAITFYYFYQIEEKTTLEMLLTLFIGITLISDILFTLIFFKKKL
jgi:hypothetical protein